ncbi:MAG: hypothetical protein AAGB13_07405 [Cyanobacteria bacterium P01_F01_bin.33]
MKPFDIWRASVLALRPAPPRPGSSAADQSEQLENVADADLITLVLEDDNVFAAYHYSYTWWLQCSNLRRESSRLTVRYAPPSSRSARELRGMSASGRISA